jgi:predicted DNA-binding transcriptional regulator YafY
MVEFGFCKHIEFEYVNYKGERETRRVCMHRIAYGATEYHPQPQWILFGFCMDRGADRGFAMRDMSNVRAWSPGAKREAPAPVSVSKVFDSAWRGVATDV